MLVINAPLTGRLLQDYYYQYVEHARGEQASDWELGVAMGEIRRSLSFDFVRAEVLYLLARVCLLGGRAKEAARRRVQAERDVEVARRVEMTN